MLKGQIVYLLVIDWVNDGEDGVTPRIFEKLEDARAFMKEAYETDLKNYLNRWEEQDIDCAFGPMNAYMNPRERYSEYHVNYVIQEQTIL